MRNTGKFIRVCSCMIGAGVILSGIGYALGGRVWGISVGHNGIEVNTPNITGENIRSYLEETKELEQFTSMQVLLDYGDFVIEPSDHYGVSYCVDAAYDFSAEVVDGCLKITEKYPDSIMNIGNATGGKVVFFGIGRGQIGPSKSEYVKVYVPADTSFDLVKIESGSGKVLGSDVRAEEFELKADYGNVSLEGLESQNAVIALESGNLELTDFSDGNLTIENDYGKAVLKNVAASGIAVSMESGNFESTGLQGDSLLVMQEYGAVKLEYTMIGGAAEINSESGDIELTYMGSETLKLVSAYGNVRGDAVSTGEGNFMLESGDCVMDAFSIGNLELTSDYGNVKLSLTRPVEDYTWKLLSDYGLVKINGEDMGTSYKSLESQENLISVKCESGDITVKGKK